MKTGGYQFAFETFDGHEWHGRFSTDDEALGQQMFDKTLERSKAQTMRLLNRATGSVLRYHVGTSERLPPVRKHCVHGAFTAQEPCRECDPLKR